MPILALVLVSRVTLGMLPHLSVPQFPPLYNEGTNTGPQSLI